MRYKSFRCVEWRWLPLQLAPAPATPPPTPVVRSRREAKLQDAKPQRRPGERQVVAYSLDAHRAGVITLGLPH
jgi:hypothetical protein